MILFKNSIYRIKQHQKIYIYQILCSIGLNDVGLYLRDGTFSSDIGVFNIHPSKGTYWVCYINENNFDSSGCVPHRTLSKFIIKRNVYCLYSEYQIQKRILSCKLLFVYNLLDKVIGIDFKSSVFNLYHQMIR